MAHLVKRYFPGAVVALCLAGPVQAGIITSVTTVSLPGGSTGTVGPVGATPAPNNDNTAAASPNTVPYSIFFNTFGPMQVEFATNDSGGTTEYRFTQTFVNNTGQAWTGFVFELGFGLGAAFTPSGAADGLDFDWSDADPAPTASLFSTLSHQGDRIEWSGGSVPSIGALAFTFAIDVSDGLAAFNPNGVNRFTLRQTPIAATLVVPEPSSLLLLGIGIIALVWWRRKPAGISADRANETRQAALPVPAPEDPSVPDASGVDRGPPSR